MRVCNFKVHDPGFGETRLHWPILPMTRYNRDVHPPRTIGGATRDRSREIARSVHPSPDNATDGELVAAVLAGADGEFARLVRRYQTPLLRAARSRLGNIERAEDVVQETFMNAHRWLRTYDSRFSFRTWLWTILLRQCSRNHARQNRTPLVHNWSSRPVAANGDQPEAQPACDDPSPPLQLLAKERAELLEHSLQQLPVAEADALRLRFYGHLKFQEIADAMQCGISTAKNRVKNGLIKLAEIVTETEALSEADTAAGARPRTDS
jgi:RNA polymerase sigma-70 factor, ECF subfamily